MNRVTLAHTTDRGPGPRPSSPVVWGGGPPMDNGTNGDAWGDRWTACLTNALTHSMVSGQTLLILSVSVILSVFFPSILHLR
ncbi:MAG: hypothetical protein D6723_05605 [Acidobacteria bacterium]|nr:MAG: hypothetical protein D6723_05605 [Acidobacteriota bacterium]